MKVTVYRKDDINIIEDEIVFLKDTSVFCEMNIRGSSFTGVNYVKH